MKIYTPLKKISLGMLTLCFLSACGGGGSNSQPAPSPTPSNIAPAIDTLEASPVLERSPFDITATASDSDGTVSSYKWIQSAGTKVVNFLTDNATMSFDAPNVSEDETITFSLTVTDNDSATTVKTLDILVQAYDNVDFTQIPDPELKACLEEQGDVDLGSTSIECDGFAIQLLSDLTQFPRLDSLTITNALLSYIGQLQALTSLKHLNLSNNFINDASAISTLTTLESLNLSSNFIHNIGNDLSELVLLKELNLGNPNLDTRSISTVIGFHALDDITSLTKLQLNNIRGGSAVAWLEKQTNLQHLEITGFYTAGIRTLNFLLKMPELRYLDMSDSTQVVDLSPLAQMKNLTYLDIKNFTSNDLSPLSSLNKLEYLNLSNYDIDIPLDLALFENLTNLKTFYLDGNASLTNKAKLSSLINLETLSLEDTDITSLSFLSGMPNLKALFASSNSNLSDLSHLIDLPNLEKLDLAGLSSIDDLSAIKNLAKLKVLNLSNLSSDLTIDLLPLKSLSLLEELNLSNLSSDLTIDLLPLESLSLLEKLNLSFNHNLSNIQVIGSFTSLKSLKLKSFASSLPNISALTSLETLDISINSNISNLDQLKDLDSLVSLDASFLSSLNDISGLSDLHNLESIDLRESELITDITALKNKPKLKFVDLSFMPQLKDISALLELNSPDEINLLHNTNIRCDDIILLINSFPFSFVRATDDCVVGSTD